jgi:hypothetical protein
VSHLKGFLLLFSFISIGNFLLPAYCTTIAWSGTELACDSQSTGSHTKYHSAVPKIMYSKTRHATIAAAGDVSVTAPIKKFFMSTDKPLSEYKIPATARDGSFGILIIYDDGTAEIYLANLTDPAPVDAPFALGSGEDFAMAAMLCGKTAAEAVEIAKQLDLYTGGHVSVLQAPKVAASH